MKIIIGIFLGAFIVLAILASWTYFDYEEQTAPTKDHNFIETIKPSIQASVESSAELTSEPVLKKAEVSTAPPEVTKNVLYQWRDNDGQLIIGSNPPLHSKAAPYIPDSGMSVLEFVETKTKSSKPASIKQNTRPRIGNNFRAESKDSIIAKNHTHCRWLVGRAKNAYDKILRNQSSRASIWCDEHKKWLREMRKLSVKGDGCYYPHRTPSSCY